MANGHPLGKDKPESTTVVPRPASGAVAGGLDRPQGATTTVPPVPEDVAIAGVNLSFDQAAAKAKREGYQQVERWMYDNQAAAAADVHAVDRAAGQYQRQGDRAVQEFEFALAGIDLSATQQQDRMNLADVQAQTMEELDRLARGGSRIVQDKATRMQDRRRLVDESFLGAHRGQGQRQQALDRLAQDRGIRDEARDVQRATEDAYADARTASREASYGLATQQLLASTTQARGQLTGRFDLTAEQTQAEFDQFVSDTEFGASQRADALTFGAEQLMSNLDYHLGDLDASRAQRLAEVRTTAALMDERYGDSDDEFAALEAM